MATAQELTQSDFEKIQQLEIEPFENINLPASTYEIIHKTAIAKPDADALKFFLQGEKFQDSVDFSYQQILEQIIQASNMFHQLGVAKNDVISTILPNIPEMLFSFWGGQRTGIVAPINPLLEPEQIIGIMNAQQAKVLVTIGPFPKTNLWQKAMIVREQVPTLEHIIIIDLKKYLKGIPKLIVTLVSALNKSAPAIKGQTMHSYESLHSKQDKVNLLTQRVISKNDFSSFFHTGGTTGTPKIARRTHANEVFNSWTTLRLQEELSQEKLTNEVSFCGLPLFHVNAITVTGLIPWSYGGCIVLGTPSGFRGEGVVQNFWKITEHYKINFFSGVPTLYKNLLAIPVGAASIDTLKIAFCGAAPMPVHTITEFEKNIKVRILEGYGQTEGTCISSMNPPIGKGKIGSVGLSLPYTQIKIVKKDSDGTYQECQTNEEGMIIISGPHVFHSYMDEEHNQGIWITLAGDEKKWLDTGDLGRMDEDHYYWISGRAKEIIIRSGHNIDPLIIENPFYQHPGVLLAAAVPRPDEKAGELPVCYIQLKSGNKTTIEELKDWAQQHISEQAAIPKKIKIIETMPLTPVGKIFKPELKSLEIKDVINGKFRSINTDVSFDLKDIEVKQDRIYGSYALITVDKRNMSQEKAIETLDHSLSGFTFKYKINFV
ncbi:MAG: acyl-CoA synthetase [Zetaproteobacteria bacterium]|nr:acyl-CoA synthetase [Pseudobdellovibrionaceae bacterium]